MGCHIIDYLNKIRVDNARVLILEKDMSIFDVSYVCGFEEQTYFSKVFKADDFTVSDSCVGCGLCAKLCPLNNIMITDGKPSWGSTCTHCMACLGNCPKEAIEYGERTVNKGKYNLKRYKYYVDELKGK